MKAAMDSPYFHIRERFGDDGAACLQLVGELDMGSVEVFAHCVRRASASRGVVRVDLALLDFIDSSGIAELIRAVQDSERQGWQLDISSEVAPQVRGVIELVGLAPLLWPEPAFQAVVAGTPA